MTYSAWTSKTVEFRVVEAAETLMQSPNDYVGGGGNGWPEYVPHYPRSMKVRVRPTPSAISRMMETWGWINTHPSESERKLLYSWAWVKTRRGKFLNDFAAREGIGSKTLRRAITSICQAIADKLNQQNVAWRAAEIDDVSEIDAQIAPSKVSSQSYDSHFAEPGAKPKHLPNSREHLRLIRRIEEQNRKRRAS